MPCPCTVCGFARINGLEYTLFMRDHKCEMGRPTDKTNNQPQAKNLTLCHICYSEVAQGKPHNCVKTQKRENLAAMVRNSSVGSKSKVLAVNVKEIAEIQGQSTKGGTIHLQSGANILPIKIGNSRSRQKVTQFSHASFRNLGTRLNLSNNDIM